MRSNLTLGLLTGLGIIAGSGMAMAATPTNNSMANKTDGGATSSMTTMSAPGAMSHSNVKLGGTLRLTHGMLRTSQLDGATIYNEKGKSVGTLKNILITTEGSASKAVISADGHMIEVPFSDLKYQESNPKAKVSSSGKSNNKVDYSVVYPNATTASLKSKPKFQYDPKNN